MADRLRIVTVGSLRKMRLATTCFFSSGSRRNTISISLAENDVGWVIVAVNADVGEFEANAGQHHEFDAIDFDFTAQAGSSCWKEEVLRMSTPNNSRANKGRMVPRDHSGQL